MKAISMPLKNAENSSEIATRVINRDMSVEESKSIWTG
jgi:hypothetical protein